MATGDIVNTERLISLVFERNALWDNRLKKHANRYAIGKQWKEVARIMEVEEYKLRKKWKYLRDQFSIELTRSKTRSQGDSAGETEESKWPHFKLLLFLKDVVKDRPAVVNQNLANEMSNDQFPSRYRESTIHVVQEPTDSVLDNNGDFSGIQYLHDKMRPQSYENNDDEDFHFLKSLMPHVKKIPDHKKMAFRCRIQEIVERFAYPSTSS